VPSREFKLVAAVVVAIAVLQIAIEDLLMFLATTGSGVPAWLSSPLVMVAIPMTLMLVLFAVLFGAVLFSDREGPPPRV